MLHMPGRFPLLFALVLSAGCGGGGVVGGGSSSSRPAGSEAAPPPPASVAPTPPASAPSAVASAEPPPADGPSGFDSAETLSKALVDAQGAGDADAARVLYPSDEVIDAIVSCKGVKNMKITLGRRRDNAADAVTHPGKNAPSAYEWVSLDPPGKPRRRKAGKEVDGCTFKVDVPYYKLKIHERVTPGGSKAKKPKKKTKTVDAFVVGERWYLASKL